MQNFSLLKKLGRLRKPVLLKRGMSATIEELLLSAEYLLAEGNYEVILCERGVRTFADHTRNTLDLSAVPYVQRISHLPILVDPSHGTGKRQKVLPLSRAAVAVGADGLLIEVHNDPEAALSDGPQAILPEMFARADAAGAPAGAGGRADGVKGLLVLEDGTAYRGRGDRAAGHLLRRDRLQHRDERLPGGPDRPVVLGPDRRDDGGARRQLRHPRRGGRVGPRARGRIRRAGLSGALERHRGRGEPRGLPRAARRDRPPWARHAGARAADPERGRHARRGLDRDHGRRGAPPPGPRLAGHDRERSRSLGLPDAVPPSRPAGGAARSTASPPSTTA